MKENKHGFEPKQEFTMGGIAWTVIQTGADWVKCIASECVEERAFDEENKNDFAASSLREWLNGEFLRRLIKAGAPEEMFEYFNIDLTADDGLKNYGGDRVRIGLITCEEYRLLRGNIPALPGRWWWTATPDSPINSYVRTVVLDGTLGYGNACIGDIGVRPLCNLKSEILVSYLNGENAEETEGRSGMKIGTACAIFLQINSEKYTDEEKGTAILKMPTHNGISKSAMLEVIGYLLNLAFDVPEESEAADNA